MNVTIKTDPYDVLNYMQIRDMKKGQTTAYLVGTTKEIHNPCNKQQMGVIREAIRNGIATATQEIIGQITDIHDIGVDISNVYSYNVVRI